MEKINKSKTTAEPLRGAFYEGIAKVDDGAVIVKFPASVAKYLDIQNGGKVFWVPVNGVVQVSGKQPNVTIPVMNVGLDAFIPQRKPSTKKTKKD